MGTICRRRPGGREAERGSPASAVPQRASAEYLQAELELYITWIIGTLDHASGCLDQTSRLPNPPAPRYDRSMLAWTKAEDGLHANGYVIRLMGPFQWVLSEATTDSAQVRLTDEPLATARTLAAAKREAELLVAANRRSALRRRWIATALLASGSTVFTAGAAAPWGFVLTFALVVIAIRSVGLLTGMLLAPFVSQHDDLIYQ